VPAASSKIATTEQRNPRTRGLDLLSTREILLAINREDAAITGAVAREVPAIARAAEAIVQALSSGGRVFYVGAGTSGRLATLDAAELPPTYGISPRRVQAVIAGGKRALTQAAEGAEDSAAQGARDLAARHVSQRDTVVGIAASGATPYVLGALEKARRSGAATVGITSNRHSPMARAVKVLIAIETGPEAVAGSTRMKAGTAQKLVLNMLSTTAMVRLGRVYDNWMVGVALTNQKLRRRGLRILEQAAGVNVSRATRALRQAEHDLRVALIALKTGIGAKEARDRLRQTKGNLREALGEKRRTRHRNAAPLAKKGRGPRVEANTTHGTAG
jgi:N-acetylmuramic acid 6-phosphate etherase